MPEEIHILASGGFVPGLPGIYGPGTKIAVDSDTGQPLRVVTDPEPIPIDAPAPEQETPLLDGLGQEVIE